MKRFIDIMQLERGLDMSAEAIALMVHILFNTSDKDRIVRGAFVPRGSVRTTISMLTEVTGISERKIRRALEELVDMKFIIVTSSNRYTIITVKKFYEYVGKKESEKSSASNKKHHLTDCDSVTCEDENSECVKQMSNRCQTNVEQMSNKCQTNVKQDLQPADTDEFAENKFCESTEIINGCPVISDSDADYEREEEKKSNIKEKKNRESSIEKENSISKEIQKKENEIESLAQAARTRTCYRQELDFSIVDESLRDIMQEFLSMRSKIRKPIKTQRAFRDRYNEALRLANGEIELARKIIDQSISNEWQKFYGLKAEAEPEPTTYNNDEIWGMNN